MSASTRREFLQRLLSGAAASAGTVILAQSVLAETNESKPVDQASPEDRADQLTDALPSNALPIAPDGQEFTAFVNRAFRNGGGFRNGGFRNGGFVNGGFRNGGFRNGGFVNGGFRNGGFRNW